MAGSYIHYTRNLSDLLVIVSIFFFYPSGVFISRSEENQGQRFLSQDLGLTGTMW